MAGAASHSRSRRLGTDTARRHVIHTGKVDRGEELLRNLSRRWVVAIGIAAIAAACSSVSDQVETKDPAPTELGATATADSTTTTTSPTAPPVSTTIQVLVTTAPPASNEPTLPTFDRDLIGSEHVEALSEAPLPVFLPVPPEAFVVEGALVHNNWYSINFEIDQAQIFILGQESPQGAVNAIWEPNYVEVHAIQEFTVFTDDGFYTVALECAGAYEDPRCADGEYVEELFDSMALLQS